MASETPKTCDVFSWHWRQLISWKCIHRTIVDVKSLVLCWWLLAVYDVKYSNNRSELAKSYIFWSSRFLEIWLKFYSEHDRVLGESITLVNAQLVNCCGIHGGLVLCSNVDTIKIFFVGSYVKNYFCSPAQSRTALKYHITVCLE